jgi:hypothetical protein
MEGMQMAKKITSVFMVLTLLFTIGMHVFAATIGQPLTSPEAGWRRYDDTDSRIQYIGSTWSFSTTTTHYNSTCHIQASNPVPITSKVEFKFYGTKVRIISPRNLDFTAGLAIFVDGVQRQVTSVNNSELIFQILNFEIAGLSMGVHTVSIHTLTDERRWNLDAIDVDETGYLVDFNIPDAPGSLSASAGDSRIDLNWSATSGSAISYNVKRSTGVDGNYSTIATTSAITYTDNSVVNGTTYYYTVSAVNSYGEGPNSNAVSATPAATVNPPSIEGNKAILEITMINGTEKEYDLTAAELLNFLAWYDGQSSGVGKAYYTFTIKNNIKPFLNRKEYIAFDKMQSFEVKDYNE